MFSTNRAAAVARGGWLVGGTIDKTINKLKVLNKSDRRKHKLRTLIRPQACTFILDTATLINQYKKHGVCRR